MEKNDKYLLLKRMIDQNVPYGKFVTFFAKEMDFASLPFVDNSGRMALASFGEFLEMRFVDHLKLILKGFFSPHKITAFSQIYISFYKLAKPLEPEYRKKLAKIIKDGEQKSCDDEKKAMEQKYLKV